MYFRVSYCRVFICLQNVGVELSGFFSFLPTGSCVFFFFKIFSTSLLNDETTIFLRGSSSSTSDSGFVTLRGYRGSWRADFHDNMRCFYASRELYDV